MLIVTALIDVAFEITRLFTSVYFLNKTLSAFLAFLLAWFCWINSIHQVGQNIWILRRTDFGAHIPVDFREL